MSPANDSISRDTKNQILRSFKFEQTTSPASDSVSRDTKTHILY
jgi:hypothetical protein